MSENYTVLPHASGTLLVEYHANSLRGILYGPATKPDIVGYNPAEMLVIIELQPAGLFAFTGICQNEITDVLFPLELVDSTLCKQLFNIIEEADSVFQLVENFDQLLLQNLRKPLHPQLGLTFRHVIDHGGNVAVRTLANDICYSERQLNRIFQQYVGTNVKTFAKLVRMNNACRLLQHSSRNIEQISELAGFHDPSHFVHDFQAICGITPHNFRENMSDFYNEIAKFG